MKQPARVSLAHLPTPVEELPRLSKALGGPRLLVKRDDQTGLALGGNKTRKLEFLVAAAKEAGARTLITAGADQSNHCRQTAAAAARAGLDCILVLNRPAAIAGDSASEVPTGNLLLDHLLGAEIVWTGLEQRHAALETIFEQARQAGRAPYLIPYGGSNAIGASGYIFALQELLAQGLQPDWIVFASSSGGTQAGLAAGARLFNFSGKVLGISVDEPENVLQARAAKLACETADFLGERLDLGPENILVNADYLGGGYGVVGPPEQEALALFARHEGLLLDPVYTGRAAAGLIDLIRRDFFHAEQQVLFWHTGGTPALFAGRYEALGV